MADFGQRRQQLKAEIAEAEKKQRKYQLAAKIAHADHPPFITQQKVRGEHDENVDTYTTVQLVTLRRKADSALKLSNELLEKKRQDLRQLEAKYVDALDDADRDLDDAIEAQIAAQEREAEMDLDDADRDLDDADRDLDDAIEAQIAAQEREAEMDLANADRDLANADRDLFNDIEAQITAHIVEVEKQHTSNYKATESGPSYETNSDSSDENDSPNDSDRYSKKYDGYVEAGTIGLTSATATSFISSTLIVLEYPAEHGNRSGGFIVGIILVILSGVMLLVILMKSFYLCEACTSNDLDPDDANNAMKLAEGRKKRSLRDQNAILVLGILIAMLQIAATNLDGSGLTMLF